MTESEEKGPACIRLRKKAVKKNPGALRGNPKKTLILQLRRQSVRRNSKFFERAMKKEWNDVREFHEKFGHPVASEPRMLETGRALSRGKWMNEEVAEFLVAKDIYEQADAMIDLMYFALGTLVEMGLEADELFEIVQRANMAKLWPDGKPHYNPKDNKVIKPEGWEDPAPKIKAYIDGVIAAKRRG